MAERNIMNVLYKLRGDTLSNWSTKNPVLAEREPAIVMIPADSGSGLNEPAVLLKIGDGTTAFNDLGYVSAIAGDVPAWAKEATKPTYNADEITGIDAYIAAYVNEQMGISVDTDTQYTIVPVDGNAYQYKLMSKSKADAQYTTEVAVIDIPKYDDTALAGRVSGLEGLVGNTAVSAQIAAAIEALKLADTYEAKGAAAAVQGETTSTVKDVEDALNTYKTDNDAAVAAAKKAGDDAQADLNNYKTTNDEAVAAAQKAGDDAMAEAQKKVGSVGAGDASVTVAGTDTAPTVAVKLDPAADNAIKLGENGLKVEIGAAPEYTIEKAAESGEYAAIYTLMKDGVQAGASINIPKDMVVESGAVVENPAGQAEGTYIELKLQNVTEPLYINVGSLIEYVTSGSQTGDMVVIAVSDDHKVTATITDGSITLAKLATEIQTAIGMAHSHENTAVLAGITEQKIADYDDAVAKKHEHANKDVLDGINEAKVAGWDAAEQNAKDYADDLNTAMDTRVKALEDVGATKVEASETNGNIKINGTETPVYVLPTSVLDAGDTFIFDGGNA